MELFGRYFEIQIKQNIDNKGRAARGGIAVVFLLAGGCLVPHSWVLGAIFIGLVQNGMNLARIESYLQIVVIGILLIVAVMADQLRQKMVATLRD